MESAFYPTHKLAEMFPPMPEDEIAELAAERFGVSERSIHMARQIERADPELFERVTSGAVSLNEAFTEAKRLPYVTHNSGCDFWFSPAEIVERARRALGGEIALDPASSAEANAVVRAKAYYTAEDDALKVEWQARTLWLNPPFSRGLIGRFCEKVARHYENGDVGEAVALTNNASETRWFQALTRLSSGVVFPRGRLNFWKAAGEGGAAGPLQGQAIVYLGPDPRRFFAAFDGVGIRLSPFVGRAS